eukprot:gnl/MRDRNA2_/MRDRNA2_65005_c0_seq1.p1 gnl/MRDRNA2_/MRDRNA2_65005_c0~~gnl/MRDRNA2_/MRDRNA2_65005_c0_seq1.p1  ORF type:complete len:934 (+),score=150.71 gnl/MRDRNA2_/MRDRNA2_65005_c0_seq1:155-2956(+)
MTFLNKKHAGAQSLVASTGSEDWLPALPGQFASPLGDIAAFRVRQSRQSSSSSKRQSESASLIPAPHNPLRQQIEADGDDATDAHRGSLSGRGSLVRPICWQSARRGTGAFGMLNSAPRRCSRRRGTAAVADTTHHRAAIAGNASGGLGKRGAMGLPAFGGLPMLAEFEGAERRESVNEDIASARGSVFEVVKECVPQTNALMCTDALPLSDQGRGLCTPAQVPPPRELRYNPNINLKTMLDVSFLDLGFDWRFHDCKQWLDCRLELKKIFNIDTALLAEKLMNTSPITAEKKQSSVARVSEIDHNIFRAKSTVQVGADGGLALQQLSGYSGEDKFTKADCKRRSKSKEAIWVSDRRPSKGEERQGSKENSSRTTASVVLKDKKAELKDAKVSSKDRPSPEASKVEPSDLTDPLKPETTTSSSKPTAQECRIWLNLTRCVLAGTRQATERDSYPALRPRAPPQAHGKHKNIQSPWVDLSAHRRRLLRMNFFGTRVSRHRLPNPKVIFGMPTEPPLVCCAYSALEAATHVMQGFEGFYPKGAAPGLIMAADLDLEAHEGRFNGGELFRPMPDRSTIEALLLRTDAEAFLLEAERRLETTGSSPLKAHFTAKSDPYVLYCEDVALFRQGCSAGYAFMEAPLVFDVVLHSMAAARPALRARQKTGEEQQLHTSSAVDDEYTSEELEHALEQRLGLVAESCISVGECNETRQKDVQPVLVLTLPGCLNGRRHPVGGVARLVRGLREAYAKKFTAIVVACGEDVSLAQDVDQIINRDFHENHKEVADAVEEANWCPFHKNLLRTLSAHSVWRAKPKPKQSNPKSRIRRTQTGCAEQGHIKSEFPVTKTEKDMPVDAGSKFASLVQSLPHGDQLRQIIEEREKRIKAREEAKLSKDVRKLAEHFESAVKNPSKPWWIQKSVSNQGFKLLEDDEFVEDML